MTDLPQVFNYKDRQIRVVIRNGEPWWVAKDVCDVLEISKYRDAVSRLDPDERGAVLVDTLGGPQEMAAVNEPGLYSLIMVSRKPEAHAFKRWVTHEVLPTIRKTGSYTVDDRRLPQTYLEALEELVRTEKVRLALEAQVREQTPKVELYNVLLSAKNAQTMGEVAKALGWGRNRLFAYLRSKGVLMRNNLPYQQYLEAQYFQVREVSTIRREITVNVTQTLVTPKGLDFIANLLRLDGALKIPVVKEQGLRHAQYDVMVWQS
jgi:prophage antirepressor-like protein